MGALLGNLETVRLPVLLSVMKSVSGFPELIKILSLNVTLPSLRHIWAPPFWTLRILGYGPSGAFGKGTVLL